MACSLNEETICLIDRVKTRLGDGVRTIEIGEDKWCHLLEDAVEEYIWKIQKWLITNQWSHLANQNITNLDICYALTAIDSHTYTQQMEVAYSKQVGLGTNSKFELKKDWIQLNQGQQVYEIPANREVNRVLWVTPSTIDHATFSALGYGNMAFNGFGGGVAMGGSGGGAMYGMGNGGHYLAPAYDIILRAADISLKNRILKGDLTYKITGGADGKKLLHLYSIPNKGNGSLGRKALYNCKVWYHYYDTNILTPEEVAECRDTCKDIIKYPSDVPLPQMDFCDLNPHSKIWVRKFLLAIAKETLGNIRGKFSGQLAVPDAELKMDYESLLAQAEKEMEDLKTEIEEWLMELSPEKILEKSASRAENLNTTLKYDPMGVWVI